MRPAAGCDDGDDPGRDGEHPGGPLVQGRARLGRRAGDAWRGTAPLRQEGATAGEEDGASQLLWRDGRRGIEEGGGGVEDARALSAPSPTRRDPRSSRSV